MARLLLPHEATKQSASPAQRPEGRTDPRQSKARPSRVACPARALALFVGGLCLVAAGEAGRELPAASPRLPEVEARVKPISNAAMAFQRGERLDLNVAGATDLELLPRIGPALAERIIALRTQRGRFERVDDLLMVRGIGVRTLERLRPLVSIETRASELSPPPGSGDAPVPGASPQGAL